jgi:Fur family peroxide stress response transcriptional regulator
VSTHLSDEVREVVEELKSRGYRMTPQRVLLTKMILETVERHPSLKDLHDRAQSILPGVGISTVYNTIMMLETLGVIKVFYLDGKLYIDRAKPHVNIVCRDANMILDLDGGAMGEILRVLEARGVRVSNPLIIVAGECGKQSRTQAA